jgi:hypothetical protein
MLGQSCHVGQHKRKEKGHRGRYDARGFKLDSRTILLIMMMTAAVVVLLDEEEASQILSYHPNDRASII